MNSYTPIIILEAQNIIFDPDLFTLDIIEQFGSMMNLVDLLDYETKIVTRMRDRNISPSIGIMKTANNEFKLTNVYNEIINSFEDIKNFISLKSEPFIFKDITEDIQKKYPEFVDRAVIKYANPNAKWINDDMFIAIIYDNTVFDQKNKLEQIFKDNNVILLDRNSIKKEISSRIIPKASVGVKLTIMTDDENYEDYFRNNFDDLPESYKSLIECQIIVLTKTSRAFKKCKEIQKMDQDGKPHLAYAIFDMWSDSFIKTMRDNIGGING